MTISGINDKDFLMIIILYHESAITMTEDEITHGKQLELKKYGTIDVYRPNQRDKIF